MILASLLISALGAVQVPSPLPSSSVVPPATASVSPAAPSAPAVPEASALPAASPLPAPKAATPLPALTATPSPYKYRYVPGQPAHPGPGVPQIFAVYLNDDQLHSGGPILIKVTTSPDVVKVVSRNGGHEGVVPLVSPGDFEAVSKLPKVPFIAEGMTLDLEFVATSSSGMKTSVRVPVKLK